MKINSKKFPAFTLIELLVVIAIIAILTSVSILGLQEVRKRAQDTTRLSDLKQTQIALETYKSVNGKYPDAGTQGTDSYIVGLAPVFINKLFKDPSGTHDGLSGYVYSVNSDKKIYCFEIINTVNKAQSQLDLIKSNNSSLGKNWIICSNGSRIGVNE